MANQKARHATTGIAPATRRSQSGTSGTVGFVASPEARMLLVSEHSEDFVAIDESLACQVVCNGYGLDAFPEDGVGFLDGDAADGDLTL